VQNKKRLPSIEVNHSIGLPGWLGRTHAHPGFIQSKGLCPKVRSLDTQLVRCNLFLKQPSAALVCRCQQGRQLSPMCLHGNSPRPGVTRTSPTT